MPIQLTKVRIGQNKYYALFRKPDGTDIRIQIQDRDYPDVLSSKNIEVKGILQAGGVWKRSSVNISFITSSGNLSDNQYATQENGFHWVKIAGYKIYKIAPELIVSDLLSDEGISFIQVNSEAE